MPQLPILKRRDLVRILGGLGFVSLEFKGSHEFYKHPDGRSTEVPHHGGKQEIDRVLLGKILRQIEITKEEFLELL